MEDQLAYALVTPYSIHKSRTGGILGRLLSRTGLELVGGRLFAPGADLVKAYAQAVVTEEDHPRHRATQELIREYVLRQFGPAADGRRPRALLFVLRGPDAVAKVRHAVGHIVRGQTTGETIRDTYGDYVVDAAGQPAYFEPAVLAAPTPAAVEHDLRLLARFSDQDGGLLNRVDPDAGAAGVEKTLVLIKPDNFRFPNARPGAVMDLFSRTGLTIVAFKVHHMSVAEAEEFYGPVLAVLQDKLKAPSGARARLAVERELGLALSPQVEQQLAETLGPLNGRHNWEMIVQFMSGRRPDECTPEEKRRPGTEKCVAIVYQGVDAVRKIREVLGPTDPAKAPPGSIRREFGVNIMVNAAHASDAPENAAREMGIIKIQENDLRPLIEEFYGAK